jgi:hypothetical protein
MLAIHNPFTQQMDNHLKSTVMGLGLVRLLLDAGRTREARRTLHSLDDHFKGIANRPARPNRKAGRLKRGSKIAFRSPSTGAARTAVCEMPFQPMFIV